MDIFNLPQDIFPDNPKANDSIIIHAYSAPVGSFKGKSILHKNAISLVISGEKTMHFADKSVYINPDEFHFLSAGNCLVTMNLSPKQAFSSILIFFDDEVLAGFYLKYNELITRIKSKEKIENEPYLAFKKDAFVLNFISSLNLLISNNHELSMQMRQLKFEELMLHLLEKYPARILSFQNIKNKNLSAFHIRKVVETNVVNNMGIDDMAFLCNMSISTFKRRFAEIYKTSPAKWILQRRMELAKELLQNNEKPGEVFYKIGYQNHSSFSQAFKQTYGITPKEFRDVELNVYR